MLARAGTRLHFSGVDMSKQESVGKQGSAPERPRRGLGRGLESLLGGSATDATAPELAPPPAGDQSGPTEISVVSIDPNPFQPRKDFDAETLNELAESIRLRGILQPPLVRRVDGRFQLIAGERRWRAAQLAGLSTIPCRVMELDDQQVCEAAIEENLKRKDLHVLEKAQAFRDYLKRFDSSIEQLARQLGLNRSTVSNMLRLLELDDEVKQQLRTDAISSGHARALLSLEPAQQRTVCHEICQSKLSVRQTEQRVRELQSGAADTISFPNGGKSSSREAAKTTPTSHILSLQDRLREMLGAKVEIRLTGKNSGRIIVEFQSNDDFERIIQSLRKAA